MLNKTSLIEKIWTFLKKPKYIDQIAPIPWFQKFWDSFRTYNFFVLFSIITLIISSMVLSQLGNGVENEISNLVDEVDILLLFFLLVIFAPISEEIIFRIWLRVNPLNLAFGLGFIIYFFFSLAESYGYININDIIKEVYNFIAIQANFNFGDSIPLLEILWVLIINLAVLIISISLIYFLLKKNPKLIETIRIYFGKHFGFIFYLSSLTFGLIHITNYTGLNNWWFVGPFLVLPQIIAGLELGFVRVHWGMFWAIFNHALNNFVPFLIIFAFSFLSQDFLDESNNQSEIVSNYNSTDYQVLTSIGLGFIIIFLINFSINIFNFVELFISISSKKKQKYTSNN